MKRSSSIKLVLIGSGLVFLSACDQKPAESKTNEHAQAALNTHPTETFTSLEECEKTYGVGKCGTKPREGGGSLFMPMILGYTLGSMMNRPAALGAQVDATRRGGFGGQAPRYAGAGG